MPAEADGRPSMDLREALEPLSRFTFDESGEGALQLVAGGLAVTGALTLFLLASAWFGPRGGADPPPARAVLTSPRPPPPSARRAPPPEAVGAFEKGLVAGRHARAHTLDEVLDRVVEGGLGDPRLVTSRPNLKVVRLHRCRGCRQAAPAAFAEARPVRREAWACEFERGFLQGAVGALVEGKATARETRCRASGADACEFEVTYA